MRTPAMIIGLALVVGTVGSSGCSPLRSLAKVGENDVFSRPASAQPIAATPTPSTEAAEEERAKSSVPDPAEAIDERRDVGFYRPGTGQFSKTPRSAKRIQQPQAPGTFTLNFQNTDLQEVVKVVLTDILKSNYVVDPAVTGTVTLQTSRPLSRKDLLPTLEMLLRMNGAAAVFDGATYRIVPRESAVRGLVTPQLGNVNSPLPAGFGIRIAPLRFVGAEEMSKILAPFVTPGNVLRVDTQRNLLILAGTSSELARLLETIDIFDVDWIAGMSVGLFTPEFVDTKTLSEELTKIFGLDAETPLAGMMRFVTIERLNALLVVTPKREHLSTVREWINRLDQNVSGTGQRLYIYHVQNGKATDLAELLTRLFEPNSPTAVPAAELAPGLRPAEVSAAGAPAPAPAATTQNATSPEAVAAIPASPAPAPARESTRPSDGLAIGSSKRLRVIADESNNALLLLATRSEYRQILAALRGLDIAPLQVLIEATIAEITLTDELEHGLEWFFKNNMGKKSGGATLDLGVAGLSAIAPGFSYAVTDAAGVVRAVLNTLASDSRLNVISSPSVMVLNNQEARIRVGDEIPITTQQQQSTSTTANIVNSIEFRETGVLLSVKPRVNAGGLVTMDILQEVSDVAPGTGASLTPTIQQRTISSSVAVNSGQTVVLGGLIRENRIYQRSGFPGLYRLPVIGGLFGATTDNKRRTELVVLITPRAIRNGTDARRVADEFRDKFETLQRSVQNNASK